MTNPAAKVTSISGLGVSELEKRINVDNEYKALIESEDMALDAIDTIARGMSACSSYIRKANISICDKDAVGIAREISQTVAHVFEMYNGIVKLHMRAASLKERRDLEVTMSVIDKEPTGFLAT